MKIQKLLGSAFIIFGVLNLINFGAPRPIPTVGVSAFIIGLLFVGLGLYLRSDQTKNRHFHLDDIGLLIRSRLQGSPVSPDNRDLDAQKPQNRDPLLAVRVLRCAVLHHGRLTVAQTAMELNVPIDEAEAALDECTARGSAYIDADRQTGIAAYRFPEFEPREEAPLDV